MSVVDPWSVQLETELSELLAPAAAPGAEDEWRLLVLLARVALHPEPGPGLSELLGESTRRGRTQQARGAAARPAPGAVLDALDDALAGDEDPAGPLADALLEVDDVLCVLELEGAHAEARETAAQATALIELAPERASALDTWATRRLATLDEGAAAAEVWRAVESAAAVAVTHALPASSAIRRDATSVLDRADRPRERVAEVIELFTACAPVRRAWRAAAADASVAPEPTFGANWTLYTELGRVVAQLHAATGRPPAGSARLVARTGGGEWSHSLRPARRGTDCAWFELGTEGELAALFARARDQLGIGLDAEVAVHLEWDVDGEP
ncbi:MAG: hypothetical protein Q8P41_08155 [Pseudomonadota bacterium]|nr:hypothetical protein [Pseudomonadota bacterium]